MRLRLATYNIHKCIGGFDRRYDPQRVADVLVAQGPDIVLLQEAAQLGAPFRDDQPALLAALLGLPHVAFAPNVALRSGGHYGNAILSRFPLAGVFNVDLTVPPKKRRSALVARCRLRRPGGRGHATLLVASLHLGLAGIERRVQARRLLGSGPFARLRRHTPVVVGGDTNDLWGTLGRLFFDPAGFQAASRRVPTFPAYAPLRPLDALYIRGDLRPLAVHTPRGRQARLASDHLPLVVDLELGPGRPL